MPGSTMDKVEEAINMLRAQIGAIEDVLHGLHEQLMHAERHQKDPCLGQASPPLIHR